MKVRLHARYSWLFLALLLLPCFAASAQKIPDPQVITYGPDTCHARGIFYHNEKIYTANNNGFVYEYDLATAKSRVLNTKAYKELRDIHVFENGDVVAMQSADSSVIWRQSAGKESSFALSTKATFYDGIAFYGKSGLLMGDPIADDFQVFITKDKGKKWRKVELDVKAAKGEAGYAASGSNVAWVDKNSLFIATGGAQNRLLYSHDAGKNWQASNIPFPKGEGAGPFSICFWSDNEGIAVGGTYTAPKDSTGTCFYTKDGGKTWEKPLSSCKGYRSCVIKADTYLFACGSNGIDYSLDGGVHWTSFSAENTFALCAAKGKLYASTKKGKVLVFNYSEWKL